MRGKWMRKEGGVGSTGKNFCVLHMEIILFKGPSHKSTGIGSISFTRFSI
jgi:hypothetical protein